MFKKVFYLVGFIVVGLLCRDRIARLSTVNENDRDQAGKNQFFHNKDVFD